MATYQSSSLVRYVEEALAEAYATRSVAQGIRFPFAGNYVTVRGLAIEAGAVGGAAFIAYEAFLGESH